MDQKTTDEIKARQDIEGAEAGAGDQTGVIKSDVSYVVEPGITSDSVSFIERPVVMENRELVRYVEALDSTIVGNYRQLIDYVERYQATFNKIKIDVNCFDDVAFDYSPTSAMLSNLSFLLDEFLGADDLLTLAVMSGLWVLDEVDEYVLTDNFLDSYIDLEILNVLANITDVLSNTIDNEYLFQVNEAVDYGVKSKLLNDLKSEIEHGIMGNITEIQSIAEILAIILSTADIAYSGYLDIGDSMDIKELSIVVSTAIAAVLEVFEVDFLDDFSRFYLSSIEPVLDATIPNIYNVVEGVKFLFGLEDNEFLSGFSDVLNIFDMQHVSQSDIFFTNAELFGFDTVYIDYILDESDALFEMNGKEMLWETFYFDEFKSSKPNPDIIYFESDCGRQYVWNDGVAGPEFDETPGTHFNLSIEGHADELGVDVSRIEVLSYGERSAKTVDEIKIEGGASARVAPSISLTEAESPADKMAKRETIPDLDVPVQIGWSAKAETDKHSPMELEALVHAGLPMEPLLPKVNPLHGNAYQTYLSYSVPEDIADEPDINSDRRAVIVKVQNEATDDMWLY